MIRERVVPVALSVLVIVLVAMVQERSRYLAAIIAAMPLTAPLAMWIVFSASQGDQRQTADFVGSMVVGFAATLVFVLTCWFGLREAWGFSLAAQWSGPLARIRSPPPPTASVGQQPQIDQCYDDRGDTATSSRDSLPIWLT